MREDLKCYPYNIQPVLKRLREKTSICALIYSNLSARRIFFTLLMLDEAHFHLSGFIDEQNFRCWEWKIQEFYMKKMTSITRNCVVRNYVRLYCWTILILNAKGFTETVNGERYRLMLNTFLRPVVTHLRNLH